MSGASARYRSPSPEITGCQLAPLLVKPCRSTSAGAFSIPAIMTATATDSYLVIRALLDEFVRCGMEHACTCPGSRNTPIVLTLARDPRLHAWSHVDERAAGFFAVGAAKASGKPVAVTCTSGTAAANLLPAVIEARQAGVPLIVLTADRPPELRDVGAGQTIDQLKLYGDAVKWFFELGVPEATPERLRWVRSLACRAYWTAVRGTPGPGPHQRAVARAARPGRAPARRRARRRRPRRTVSPGWSSSNDDARRTPAALPRRHEFRRTVFVAGDLGPTRSSGASSRRLPRGRGCRCSPIRSRARAAGLRRSPTST